MRATRRRLFNSILNEVVTNDGELVPPTADERCGTKAGASRHNRLREKLCEACRRADTANRAKWVETNQEQNQVNQGAYYWRDPEKQRQRSRAYRAANRDAVNARRRASWRQNRDSGGEDAQ